VASADWGVLANALSIGVVDRGVTAGIAPPTGGGSFVYGFNSLANTAGSVGLYAAQVNFAPMAKGGSIRAAIKRGQSGGPTNFAPFLFLGLQAADVTAQGYLLGLSDEDPHHIVLRKGAFSGGVPAGAVTVPPTNGILRRSTASFANNTWLHLRLDMVVNLNGDVILKCFQSVLGDVTTPSWVAIAGMTDFVDDALGVNSSSAPFTSGYAGFGFKTQDITRRGFFDHVEVLRQL
jgi:hypothetical protein